MKFSDGNWMMREGFQVINPVEVHDFVINPQSLDVYAPPKHIAGRGGQLDTPLMHIRYSSPMPDVICVRMTHHKGKARSGPSFRNLPKPIYSVRNHRKRCFIELEKWTA